MKSSSTSCNVIISALDSLSSLSISSNLWWLNSLSLSFREYKTFYDNIFSLLSWLYSTYYLLILLKQLISEWFIVELLLLSSLISGLTKLFIYLSLTSL